MHFITKGNFQWHNLKPNLELSLEGVMNDLDHTYIYFKPNSQSWDTLKTIESDLRKLIKKKNNDDFHLQSQLHSDVLKVKIWKVRNQIKSTFNIQINEIDNPLNMYSLMNETSYKHKKCKLVMKIASLWTFENCKPYISYTLKLVDLILI